MKYLIICYMQCISLFLTVYELGSVKISRKITEM